MARPVPTAASQLRAIGLILTGLGAFVVWLALAGARLGQLTDVAFVVLLIGAITVATSFLVERSSRRHRRA